jgi:hypothetical protein
MMAAWQGIYEETAKGANTFQAGEVSSTRAAFRDTTMEDFQASWSGCVCRKNSFKETT